MRELRLVCGIQKPRLATTTQLTMALDALDLTARRCPIARPAWLSLLNFWMAPTTYNPPLYAVLCGLFQIVKNLTHHRHPFGRYDLSSKSLCLHCMYAMSTTGTNKFLAGKDISNLSTEWVPRFFLLRVQSYHLADSVEISKPYL